MHFSASLFSAIKDGVDVSHSHCITITSKLRVTVYEYLMSSVCGYILIFIV